MSRPSRPIPVGIRVKHWLHLGLQVQVRDRLSDPIRDSGHPEHPQSAGLLRYLDRPHRRRDVAPRGHPVPDLVEVPPKVCLERLDRLLVDTRSSLVGLDPSLPPRPAAWKSQTACRQASARSPAPPASSRLTTKQARMTRPRRSTRITGRHRYHEAVRPCAPHRYSAPRGSAAWGSPFHERPRATTAPLTARERGTTGSHVPHRSPDQARAAFMPDTT